MVNVCVLARRDPYQWWWRDNYQGWWEQETRRRRRWRATNQEEKGVWCLGGQLQLQHFTWRHSQILSTMWNRGTLGVSSRYRRKKEQRVSMTCMHRGLDNDTYCIDSLMCSLSNVVKQKRLWSSMNLHWMVDLYWSSQQMISTNKKVLNQSQSNQIPTAVQQSLSKEHSKRIHLVQLYFSAIYPSQLQQKWSRHSLSH